MRAVF